MSGEGLQDAGVRQSSHSAPSEDESEPTALDGCSHYQPQVPASPLNGPTMSAVIHPP